MTNDKKNSYPITVTKLPRQALLVSQTDVYPTQAPLPLASTFLPAHLPAAPTWPCLCLWSILSAGPISSCHSLPEYLSRAPCSGPEVKGKLPSQALKALCHLAHPMPPGSPGSTPSHLPCVLTEPQEIPSHLPPLPSTPPAVASLAYLPRKTPDHPLKHDGAHPLDLVTTVTPTVVVL